MDEPVRWTVRVSKETDVAVRTFLAQRGMLAAVSVCTRDGGAVYQ